MSKLLKLACCATILTMTAGGAFAKAHDQGNTDVPGENVGQETVSASQTLGSAKGNRPDDRAPVAPGKSEDAGK